MSKIVAISKYGFKLDSLKNEWERVDKSLLKREIFNQLSKGIDINITERNARGFILDFKINNDPIPEGVNSKIIPLNITRNHPQENISKDLSILKGQCLNLAVSDVSLRYHNGLEDSEVREIAIRNARKLFEEVLAANFVNWR